MRKIMILSSCFLALLVGGALIAPLVRASAHFDSDVVVVDGQVIAHPQGTVQNGTTYMSVNDVVEVLKAVKVYGAWSPGNLMIGTPIPIDARPQNGSKAQIYLNGRSFASVLLYRTTAQVTNVSETYVPIWYVMRALEQNGKKSSWNGHQWTINDLSN